MTVCRACRATDTATEIAVNINRKGEGPVTLCVARRACTVRARKAQDAVDAAFALEWAKEKAEGA